MNTTTKTTAELQPGDQVKVQGRYRTFQEVVTDKHGRTCVKTKGMWAYPEGMEKDSEKGTWKVRQNG